MKKISIHEYLFTKILNYPFTIILLCTLGHANTSSRQGCTYSCQDRDDSLLPVVPRLVMKLRGMVINMQQGSGYYWCYIMKGSMDTCSHFTANKLVPLGAPQESKISHCLFCQCIDFYTLFKSVSYVTVTSI